MKKFYRCDICIENSGSLLWMQTSKWIEISIITNMYQIKWDGVSVYVWNHISLIMVPDWKQNFPLFHLLHTYDYLCICILLYIYVTFHKYLIHCGIFLIICFDVTVKAFCINGFYYLTDLQKLHWPRSSSKLTKIFCNLHVELWPVHFKEFILKLLSRLQ